MPKLTSSNPKYRKHRASGQAIVTLDGKDFYLGPHGTRASRTEYDRLVGEWLQSGRRLPIGRGGAPPDMVVVELVARFWQHAKSYYGGNGSHGGELGSYKLVLGHLKRLYGRTPIRDFNPLALKTVRQSMLDAGWARTYINRQVGRLKYVFKWGVSHGIVDGEQYRDLLTVEGLKSGKSKARETEPVKPVPDSHVDAIEHHVSRQVWAMIQLQRLTGMRPGEVIIIRTQDIDTTGKLWAFVPLKHKTAHHGIERVIYLGPKAQAVVKPWLRPNVGEYLFQPAEADAERREKLHAKRLKNGTPLNQGNKPGSNRRRRPGRKPGGRYTVDSYRRAITTGCERAFGMPAALHEPRTEEQRKERAGEDPAKRRAAREQWRAAHVWHPNQLRHNAATFLRKQFGAEAAQVILGHRNLSVTELYAEQDVAAAQRIMSEVG